MHLRPQRTADNWTAHIIVAERRARICREIEKAEEQARAALAELYELLDRIDKVLKEHYAVKSERRTPAVETARVERNF